MMKLSLARACEFLRDLERWDLAALLEGGSYTFVTDDEEFLADTNVAIALPPICADAVGSLPSDDRRRISEAIAHTDAEAKELGIASRELHIEADESVSASTRVQLLAELLIQRSLMIDVATNKVLINAVEDYYRARRKRIHSALAGMRLQDPVPFDSLWDWYGHWSKELPSYRDRRAFIRALFAGTIHSVLTERAIQPPRIPTGWERVDRTLQKARQQLSTAINEEDWQAVGLLCREALISLGQAVFVPEKHRPVDGIVPSATDAKRMLEGFVATEAPGESNEMIRRHARASLALASELVHARTADRRRAQLCLEATQSTASVIVILSGRGER